MIKKKEQIIELIRELLSNVEWSFDEQQELIRNIHCNEKLISTTKASEMLKVSSNTIMTYARKGLLTKISYGDKTNRFYLHEVMLLKAKGF